MFSVLEELGLRDRFATQAVREVVACIQNYIVSEYMAYRTIEIQLIPETFGLLIFGLAGMMKAKPDITDDELATLIAQTLRLDMTVIDPPPWPEHPDAPSRPDAVLRWRGLARRSMQDALGGYADGYLLGRFGLDIQSYGHVHGAKRRFGDPRFQHALARRGDLAPRSHEPHICQRLAEHLLQHGEIVPMAMRHDEDVIALIKGQGGSDIAVVPHDHLLRAVGFAGVRKLRTAVEQRAGKPHARQGRNGGAAPHARRRTPRREPGQGNGQHEPTVRDAAPLLAANRSPGAEPVA